MTEPRSTLRGGRPIPADYPLTPEDLQHGGDCIADVPAEKLQALVDYYGDDDPPGEPLPARAAPAGASVPELLDFTGSPHGGTHKLLPEWQSQPLITPVGLVKHTIVGSAGGAFYYFRDSTGTESTIILPKIGVIWQIMSIIRQSDAQVAGNYWKTSGVPYGFLSVETEDNGDPEHDPWTAEQIASIKWLDDKLARVFGWPRQQTPAPYGDPAAGSGYHSMWLRTQYMTPDGLQPWTLAAWKGCPATPRIGQYRNELLPAYLNQAPPEVLMALTDAEQERVLRAADQILGAVGSGQRDFAGTIEATLGGVQGVYNLTNAVRGLVAAVKASTDLQGDDEAHLLAHLTEVQRALVEKIDATHPQPEPVPEPVPEPTP